MFLLRELIPKYKYVRFEFLMMVIVALILNECFRNIKVNGLLNCIRRVHGKILHSRLHA